MNSQYRLRLDTIEKQNIEKERDQHIFFQPSLMIVKL